MFCVRTKEHVPTHNFCSSDNSLAFFILCFYCVSFFTKTFSCSRAIKLFYEVRRKILFAFKTHSSYSSPLTFPSVHEYVATYRLVHLHALSTRSQINPTSYQRYCYLLIMCAISSTGRALDSSYVVITGRTRTMCRAERAQGAVT